MRTLKTPGHRSFDKKFFNSINKCPKIVSSGDTAKNRICLVLRVFEALYGLWGVQLIEFSGVQTHYKLKEIVLISKLTTSWTKKSDFIWV